MDLLLILTYGAICIAIFKIFKIPLNKWTVPTAVLGGIVIVGTLLFAMNYNHPYSEISRQYFVTTPIVPNVNGQVISVPVSTNIPLKAGEMLFQIDPIPFQNKVLSLKAQFKMAGDDLARAQELLVKKAISVRDHDLAQSRFDQVKADLENAQYELDQTTVRAPAAGFVTQVSVRPGMRANSLPLRPLMVFVPMESRYIVGWFRQNSLLRLKANDRAEVTFDGIPGTIFSGKVKHVFNVLAEGQISPSGELINSKDASRPGRIPVTIEIDDPEFSKYLKTLPGGSDGQIAIYSKHARHLSIIRKVLIRMVAWVNYLFPLH
jgi:multidrug resistance efflux pump